MHQKIHQEPTILRRRHVEQRTGLSRSDALPIYEGRSLPQACAARPARRGMARIGHQQVDRGPGQGRPVAPLQCRTRARQRGCGGRVVCVAEGFATGASIHGATGHPVAVAFHAGNLTAVHALALRPADRDHCAYGALRRDRSIARSVAAGGESTRPRMLRMPITRSMVGFSSGTNANPVA